MPLVRIVAADVRDCTFDCGQNDLNVYFRQFALGNDRNNVGRTYVLHGDGTTLPRVIGFATIAMAQVETSTLPPDFRNQYRLPRYPMPVARIGRLAVDRRAQGQGYGETLLIDVFEMVRTLVGGIGCLGIIVDAKDDSAVRFYEKYGFVQLLEQDAQQYPRALFIAMQTVDVALAGAG